MLRVITDRGGYQVGQLIDLKPTDGVGIILIERGIAEEVKSDRPEPKPKRKRGRPRKVQNVD